jgi:hypothetical protein
LTAEEKRRQDKVDLAHSCVKQVLLDAFEKTDYRGEKKSGKNKISVKKFVKKVDAHC